MAVFKKKGAKQLRLPLDEGIPKNLHGYKRAAARRRFLKQFREERPDFRKDLEGRARIFILLAAGEIPQYFKQSGKALVEDEKAIEKAKEKFTQRSMNDLRRFLNKTPLHHQTWLLSQAYEFYSRVALGRYKDMILDTAMPIYIWLPGENQKKAIEIANYVTMDGAEAVKERILKLRSTLPKGERIRDGIGPFSAGYLYGVAFGGVALASFEHLDAIEKRLYKRGPEGFYVDKEEVKRYTEKVKDQFIKRFSLIDLTVPSEEREYFYRGVIELADILTRLGKETIERSTEGGIKKIDRPIKKETLSDISLFILSNLVNAESKLEIGKALKAIARKRLASYKREKKH